MSLIQITGVFDNSGYGVANKALAMALISAGLDVSTRIMTTAMGRLEFAKDADFNTVVKYINSPKKPQINLTQLIPMLWSQCFEKNTYNIGYFFWESDKICNEWIDIINNGLCNEVWVPCPSNYEAMMNSGIKKPVYIIPQYTKINIMDRDSAKSLVPIPNEGAYRFYSIFQWSQRKNPEALFNAYFNEFSDENVMLIAKTYGPSPFTDKRWIKETILNIKEKSGSKAPVYLFGDLMTSEQINAIHPQCDCYVYAGRAEGWNIPLLESMAYQKQIITSKTGGIADWITDNSAYIIPHKQVSIDASGQAWGAFYHSSPPQKWGDVDVSDVQKAMRQAYNERNEYHSRINHYKDILQISSEQNVVAKIKERLAEII